MGSTQDSHSSGNGLEASLCSQPMPIAIIGLAFRGPGEATSVDKLYDLLRDARETWSPIPESRWQSRAFYSGDSARSGASNVTGGHFLKDDVANFDAPFFGLSKAEALCLDPQQRLLLECTYEALENSGTPLSRASGSNTGVFVGAFTADYPELLFRDGETIPRYQATSAGNSRAMLSNRLSYFFDFKGPSVTVDTACSASMVGFHLACRALQSGDTDQAIVGGASIMLNHDVLNSMSSLGFLSPEGRCYTFDDRAQGYGRGEGIGCVLLKPLHKALADGDPVRAIVLNTGSNHDGKTNGITVPSVKAQEALIRDVYSSAGLDPSQTSYVEAHGTGTQAGDFVETSALGAVFGNCRPGSQPLLIGSIKTNIGHLEAASGVAGIIKAVLMLENKVLLPSRNYTNPNKRIKFDDWNLQVVSELQPWVVDGPRRLSINGFGYGGANAHVVMEDATTFLTSRTMEQNSTATSTLPSVDLGLFQHQKRLFVISAFDKATLRRYACNLANFLTTIDVDDAFLARLAYTLDRRRTRFSWLCAVAASTCEDLIETLQTDIQCVRALEPPVVGFIFTGQGAQWAQMGAELMVSFPAYRKSLQACEAQLRKCGAAWNLIEEIMQPASQSRVGEAEFSQPICSAVQCALVDLFRSWGIVPTAVCGHSSGEIAAAYCAGGMSLETTMTAAYFRGVVAGSLNQPGKLERKGCMMAVACAKADAEQYLAQLTTGTAVVACENSPQNVTISGDVEAVDELLALIKQSNPSIFARKLQVEVAYHSHHMQVIGDEYLACIPPITVSDRQASQFFSSVLARRTDVSDLDRSYWVANLLSEVKFSPAVSALCREAAGPGKMVNILVEIGPHSALAGPIKQIIAADPKLKAQGIVYSSALVRNKNATDTIFDVLATLASRGHRFDISQVNNLDVGPQAPPLFNLPSYPWDHSKRYWTESRLSEEYKYRRWPRTNVLGSPDRNFNPFEPRWRNIIRLSESPWVRHHQIQDGIVYPGGGYMAMAVEAAAQLASGRGAEVDGYQMREVVIMKALLIAEDPGEVETLLTMKAHSEGTIKQSDFWNQFSIYSVDRSGTWHLHCQGLIATVMRTSSESGSPRPMQSDDQHANTLDGPTAGLTGHAVDVKDFYRKLKSAGLSYGETFARLKSVRVDGHSCTARLTLADIGAEGQEAYVYSCPVHPTTFDSLLHPVFAPLAKGAASLSTPFVPVLIGDIYISARIPTQPGADLTVITQNVVSMPKRMVSKVTALAQHEVVLTMSGLELTALAVDDLIKQNGNRSSTAWNISWMPDPEFLTGTDSSCLLNDDRIDRQVNVALIARSKALSFPPTPATSNSDDDMKEDAMLDLPERPGTPLSSQAHLRDLNAYVQVEVHKNPDLRVLQIDNATEISSMLYEAMKPMDSATHASSKLDIGFSGNTLTAGVADNLRISASQARILSIDYRKGCADQEMQEHTYDLLLVPVPGDGAVVAHLAAFWAQLVKSDGRLVLLASAEMQETNPRPAALASVNEALQLSGFGTIESLSMSSELPFCVYHRSRITSLASQIHIVHGDNEDERLHAAALQDHLSNVGYTASIMTLEDSCSDDVTYLVMIEMGDSFLANPTEEQFRAMKDVLRRAPGVFWITRGAYTANPMAATSLGFLRTARAEYGKLPLVTLDLDAEHELSIPTTCALVTRLFRSRLECGYSQDNELDMEYREKDGRLTIPRALRDVETDEHVMTVLDRDRIQEQDLIIDGRPLRLTMETAGMLDSLYWEDNNSVTPSIADDSIEIEVKAAGVNFRDIMMALGQIDIESFGGECSGTITAVGRLVNDFAVGDRVAVNQLGSLATRVQAKASLACRIPEHMDFVTAAGLPVIYTTAYWSLVKLGQVQRGESVLIHAAAGGVGQAAIELCKLYGAEVFVTVGTPEKREMVRQRFDIAEDHIFSSRGHDFADGIMAATRGRGVDIVLNSVAGEAHRLTWSCVGPYGRFIELGKRDIFVNSHLEMRHFKRNVTFTAFDLVSYIQDRPAECGQVLTAVLELFENGTLKGPQPISAFPASKMEEILRKMQTGRHVGKMVVTMDRGDRVKARASRCTDQLLLGDASYLIVGGLGGLGFAIASWMIAEGARNLVFASRSGLMASNARFMVGELEKMGAKVHVVACDVGNAGAVQRLVDELPAVGMPSIRGLIQAAMSLHDGLLQDISAETYRAGLAAKVQGTLNLHRHLPRSLDFFIMLSSIIGVLGNVSQASYAAANTFLDSFARYRRAEGLSAIALDLGVITDIGHLADNSTLADSMARQGFAGTTGEQLMAMLHGAIRNPIRSEDGCQIISGLGTWGTQSLPALARPQFSHFRKLTAGNTHGSDGGVSDILSEIRALPIAEAEELACCEIISKLSELCMIAPEDIQPTKAPSQYGVDSLTAVELRSWIFHRFKHNLPMLELLGAASLRDLSSQIVSKIRA